MWRALLLTLVCALAALASYGDEKINMFNVDIVVEQDGDIEVTETINVTVEGNQIRRGIYRELPKYFLDEETNGRLPYSYNILSIRRDGNPEPYERSSEGNAVNIRIGNPDRLLSHDDHTYEIRYRVKNQIRYFDTYDEFYWNGTGTYWDFPIDYARISIDLPEGGQVTQYSGYTGGLGSTEQNFRYTSRGTTHVFETTQGLARREGLTVSIGMPKGIIDPPSAADKGWLWWARNGALTILMGSLVGLFWYYWRSFDRVGRDPVKGPVFARYEPPEGYDPAAVHFIYYRHFKSHSGLISVLMQMAMKGLMKIDVETKGKKLTTLQKTGETASVAGLPAASVQLFSSLFLMKDTLKLGDKYNSAFTSAYSAFRREVSRLYGRPYFRWNTGYLVLGVLLSAGAIALAIVQVHNWSLLLTLAVLAIVVMNVWFMYLMPAPTRHGQDVRTEIEGFRLYLETAEKLQLNAVEVGSEAPPPMTTARYEAFLPYAVALGVEKPWTKHFERLIPEEAENYDPVWTNMSSRGFRSIGGMTQGIVTGMSSGVSSSMPQSSSSSGSSGGGFSGGGGGGGGGGGW